MIARDFKESDSKRIRELFGKQNFGYNLPDFSIFSEISVVESDNNPVVVIAARPTVELYMIADREWSTPGMRREALAKAHEDMRLKLVAKEISDAHMWLPPQVAKSFSRRLKKDFDWENLNETHPDWPCLTRGTNG